VSSIKKLAQISPGETFRFLKEKEEREYGEYRTRKRVEGSNLQNSIKHKEGTP
jgi:hypothetical protein